MFARIATFEGSPDEIRAMAEGINEQSGDGPPEGVDAKEFLLLEAREGGRLSMITLFETEEALLQGDAVLNGMSPPEDLSVRRIDAGLYRVAAQMRSSGVA